MKNISQKIIIPLILTTLMNCTTIPKSLKLANQLGDYLFIKINSDNVELGYDTNNDGVEDMRIYYEIRGIDSEGTFHLNQIAIAEDKNKNGIFEKDEIINIKTSKEYELNLKNQYPSKNI